MNKMTKKLIESGEKMFYNYKKRGGKATQKRIETD